MKSVTTFLARQKRSLIIGTVVIVLGTTAMSFKENYFEISKNLEIFTSLYRDLNIYYVDDTKPGDLMKRGIDAMLESLDPYTVYIPESKIEDYRFMTTGSYGGIGANIMQLDGITYITDPYENSPAYKAGLRAGDEIISIDDKSIKGKTTEEISEILKGQANTELKVTVKPVSGGEPVTKNLVREVIKLKDVPYFGMIDDQTGFIKLVSFTETASSEVREAFVNLKEKHGMKQLVLDLRGNGGGLLREAVNIVNFFVNKGEMIVDTRGKVKEWDKVHYALNTPLDTEMPVIVLIDRGSASASEIVAGALQDLDRAVIIGERSYGKGLVQQTRDLFYNSKLKLTVAKYYIPSGRCIQKLDYSHRDEFGEVSEVPDSLLKPFKTRGGRKVIDGRGIEPDLLVTEEEPGKILRPLVEQGLFFKFANTYVVRNPSIANAKSFMLTEADYQQFMAFCADKKLEYITDTEKALADLKKVAEKEQYLKDALKEYDMLKDKLVADTKGDLTRYKRQIKMILENEIVSRYYFDPGRVESSMNDDPYIHEALAALDKTKYRSILSPVK